MTKITVVTVNFNSEEETHNLLASLAKVSQKDFSLSIIVVDNASKSPFVLLESEKKQKISFYHTEKNLGFTGGYNFGIQKALEKKADYVVILNNDTLVDNNLISEFVEVFKNNSNVGIVVPKIYFAKNHEFHKDKYKETERGKVLWYAGGFMDWKNVFSRHRGVDEVDSGQYDKVEQIDFATGCCMCIPRNVLEKVGIFDNLLYLYFEDADLSQRVLHAGFSIVYQPNAVIWHLNAASGGGSGSFLHDYYLTRNRMIFGMRYAPLRSKIALLRESVRLLFNGRKWQRKGIQDFYLRKFGRGSFAL
ncbi:MAG TPA: glycosyltransferase family 2 protein [Patescibacteria group bacterium]|jgi:GT2 family glycosyltransferase|nr:glycosyltransferase family 2 protein [Patescibacteria group bacterium]